MPKSRHRKKRKAGLPAGVVRMTPEVHAILLAQQEAFRKTGQKNSAVQIQAQMLEAMRKTAAPPQFIYAYQKTGLLLKEDSAASPRDRQAWEAAIQEYFAIEAAQANTDKPDPREWKTDIPELLVWLQQA